MDLSHSFKLCVNGYRQQRLDLPHHRSADMKYSGCDSRWGACESRSVKGFETVETLIWAALDTANQELVGLRLA